MTIFPTIVAVIAVLIIIIFFKTIVIVPNQSAFVVERLGKYHKTLLAGFHILTPFIDRLAYKHSLKELALDVAPQVCITRDNISVEIDGILYLKVVDPVKASYGIANFKFAITQLAQTTMRSEIGKIDLDSTFESRANINVSIVNAIDEASDPWGIKVTRYEIKNINPPPGISDAMEKQMRAEREKRGQIAISEGDMLSKINRAEGDKQEAIKKSEGERMKLENEARGRAYAILEVAKATAQGLEEIGKAMQQPGGREAMQLKIAQEWIAAYAELGKKSNTMIIPTNVTDLASVTAIVKSAYKFADDASTPLPPVKG
jgi:regulator of protease activity HflC (stomatin/prohibitin superfamily)